MNELNKLTRTIALGMVGCLLAGVVAAENITATLHWSKPIELGTTVTGFVSDVPVEPGQHVQKGDRLVVFDKREFQSRVNSAKASVKRNQLKFDEAVRELERDQEMYDLTMLSPHQLRMAEIRMVEAEVDLEKAKMATMLARLDLERSSIVSPFNGVVIEVMAATGQAIVNRSKLTPLVTVSRTDQMRVQFDVAASVADSLSEGQSFDVEVKGHQYQATIVDVRMHEGREDGMASIAGVFSTGGRALRAGQQATVKLTQ
ncbi:MAG: efflux RND transporter periplasmic adaptor subunit [bacterium]